MIKCKTKKYHTVGRIRKTKRKLVERGIIDTTNTQIHNLSFSGFVQAVQFLAFSDFMPLKIVVHQVHFPMNVVLHLLYIIISLKGSPTSAISDLSRHWGCFLSLIAFNIQKLFDFPIF
jgi:hypothetical protein